MDQAYAGAAAEVTFKANDQLGYLETLYIDFHARIADEEIIDHSFGFRAADGRRERRE